MASSSHNGGTTASPASPTPFVGRNPELRLLRAGLERALAGQGQTLLVVGEPGIGKTRTMGEFAALAGVEGVGVIWGRCTEWEGSPPYWPWLQVLRALMREADDTTLRRRLGRGAEDIAQIVPELRERFPDLPEPPAIDPEQARFRLFESISTFLRNAAAEQPRLLVIDDLHSADAPSLLLLQYVAAEIHTTRLLVLASYRNVEVGRQHPLARTLAELSRQQATQRVMLRGLSRDDVGRYIELTTGSAPADALAATVYDHTEGNPFFVTEVVRLLGTEAAQTTGPATAWDVRVPESVREVIGRRLERLSDECNQVLSIASVIGREFSLPLLERVVEHDTGRLLDLLDEAVQARLVEEQAAIGSYRFSHMLIQETLYDELSTAMRVRLHGAIGDGLEQLHAADLATVAPELARHFFQAAPLGRTEQAMTYLTRAAEQALAQFAWEEAAKHYEQALQVLDLERQQDQHERCTLLLALSRSQFHSGDAERAGETFRRGATLALELDALDPLATAIADTSYLGDVLGFTFDELRPLFEEVLARIGIHDSLLRVRVLGNLAGTLYYFPDTSERRTMLSNEAVAIARRLGDPATLASALMRRYEAMWTPGNAPERLADLSEAISVAAQARITDLEIIVRVYRCLESIGIGDVHTADRDLSAVAHLVEELRRPFFRYYVLMLRSLRALMRGSFAESEALAREALPIAQRTEPGTAGGVPERVFWRHLCAIRRARGSASEFEELIASVERVPAVPMRSADFNRNWKCLLTLLLAESGREADARSAFEYLSAHDFVDIPEDFLWLNSLAFLAETCAHLGDQPRACALHSMLEPHSEYSVVNYYGLICLGPVSHYLGMLATTLERWDVADQHFADALAMNQRMGAPPFVAHTQHAWAEMLLKRGRPGDAANALELAEAALATCDELGMTRLADRLRPLIDQLTPTPDANAGNAAYGLSPREMDVLRLLAAGRTDREIGEALFISHRTATTHVTNILGKLGVDTRTAAATLAVRQGIV